MVIDKIENAHLYFSLGERIRKALEYLSTTDFKKVENGKYELDGDNIFALVNQYKTKNESEGKLEAHKNYLDVQFVAEGSELIGYAPFENQKVISDYKVENDIAFFEGSKTLLEFNKGMFAILFPQDLHMPGIKREKISEVKKIVLKVKIEN